MTIERPMLPPREIETYEPFATPDSFCETLMRIERLGSCRRLVFAVTERGAADRPEPGAAFARFPINAVAN